MTQLCTFFLDFDGVLHAVDEPALDGAASQRDQRFIACSPDTGMSALPVQARLRATLADLVNRVVAAATASDGASGQRGARYLGLG